MKILWHSAHPDQPTGYGQQTALVVPRLQALGYDMAISLTFGVSGQPAPPWRGIPVFPTSGLTDIGEDTVGPAYGAWEADLCITFMCTWRSIAPPTLASSTARSTRVQRASLSGSTSIPSAPVRGRCWEMGASLGGFIAPRWARRR